MKAKINFSGEGIKKFFINNGEKVVLGLTALLLLAFLYLAITAKPLDDSKSPDAIKRESGQLASAIQVPTWSSHRGEMGLATTHFKEQTDDSMRPIPGLHVRPTHEWNPPLFPELIKRVDPEIYAVEELQIGAGCGIVPYRSEAATGGISGLPQVARPPSNLPGAHGPPMGLPPMGGPPMGGPPGGRPGALLGEDTARGPGQPGRIEQNASLPGVHAPGADAQRKSYVVITGAVPVEKEVEEFRRRFEYAVPAFAESNRLSSAMQSTGQTDQPHYFCFLIDRSEVKDANDKNRNWTPILSKTNYLTSEVIKDPAKWFTWAPEIVNPDDIFQPELTGSGDKQFSAYMTWPLPPLFLKNWGFEAAHSKVKLNIAQEAAQENQPEATQNGNNLENATPEARAGVNGRFAGPNYGNGPMPPAMGRAPGPYGGPPPGMANHGGPPGYNPGNQSVEVFTDPYKLFRFVDLMAEAGKTYRYRVQLLVYNPNYGLSTDCLDPKVIQAGSDKKRLADSPWVETSAITVPHDYQILADAVNAPGGRLAELKAKINLLAIAKTPVADSQTGVAPANPDTWVEVVKELELPLGGIVFLHDQEIDKVLDMSSESVRKVEKISVDTDQTMLLDVRNDKPLGEGKVKEATEMLLIDSSGHLFDANRAADKLVLDDYQERTKLPTDATQSPGESPVSPRPAPVRSAPYPGERGPGRATGPGAKAPSSSSPKSPRN